MKIKQRVALLFLVSTEIGRIIQVQILNLLVIQMDRIAYLLILFYRMNASSQNF